MKYLLFDMRAVEDIIGKTEFQSREFALGNDLIQCFIGQKTIETIDDIYVKKDENEGMIFAGKECDKEHIIVYDLDQSGLLEKEKNLDDLLLVFQKSFRTAIRIWNRYPFSSSERVHGTKSIVFPFVITDRRRVVIERSVKIERLEKRGITWPLLAYKYSAEDAPNSEEVPDFTVMKKAGEAYTESFSELRRFFLPAIQEQHSNTQDGPLFVSKLKQGVSDKGFRFQSYEKQTSNLTLSQKDVVNNSNMESPIRIEGPAGTGKTASMILRAYKLLKDAKEKNKPFRVIFFSHNETTNAEAKYAFSLYEESNSFMSENPQNIEFTSLLQYCIRLLKMKSSEVLEYDASEAKLYQQLIITDALDKVMAEKYKTFRPLLADKMKELFDNVDTEKEYIVSMLQHEFAVQIKGRTNSTIEEYYKLPPIKNGLPVEKERDKDFVFSIFNEYQKSLQKSSVYDCDDITIQALSQLNAPFWRRERITKGYDYIFVDEMHLFNINEQYVFHYLTKDIDQKNIPMCFALDYGQAIGDRGDVKQDYIENGLNGIDKKHYKTVFRSSQQITDFCACISASGSLMFQKDYKNSYATPTSSFTHEEEEMCSSPTIFMYPDDESMINSIKDHINEIKKETHCKDGEIAIITFEESLLNQVQINTLEEKIGGEVCVLRDRFSLPQSYDSKQQDKIVLSSPYNVNGLEFVGVILVGVDNGRVPETKDVGDVSGNYIKFSAFNKLYLSSSRAKYRLVLLGNEVHGMSPCLQYALERNRLLEKKS